MSGYYYYREVAFPEHVHRFFYPFSTQIAGIVQPCGFLDLNCGDVTKTPFDRVWKESEIFLKLRDYDNLKGKCGACEYKAVCGGCRARAYEKTGDYLAEEPLCSYEPT